ncbi:MAG TPA: rhodanese-like domain-containing protein [Aquifex aeolicus]|nr:rhodanese-like domain-containing protein [Aquificales bacterium]HIQ26706.1 rhodanese-like domain-containing protein [Aquifex aeolicus]
MKVLSLDDILRQKTKEFLSSQLKIGAPEFYQAWKEGKAIILDVRSKEEANVVKIVPAIHIPLNELPDRWGELPKDKLIAVFCPGKIRAGLAYAFLRTKGFEKVKVLNASLDDLANLEKP